MRLALTRIAENSYGFRGFGAEYQCPSVILFREDVEQCLNHQPLPKFSAQFPADDRSLPLSGVLNSIPFDCHLTL